MSEQPRDWDKELAAVDRALEQQGPETAAPGPVPAGQRAIGGATSPAVTPVPPGRGSVAITWLWALLALALAVALPLWPYQRSCGLQIIFFLGAAGITVLVGGLAAVSSWRNRRGLAHVIALLVIAWAGAMAASEILPRTGYAREVRTWTCPSAPAPAPATTPAPAN